MVFIEFIAVIFVILFLEKRKTNNVNKKVAEMTARGEFDPKDYNLFNKLWQDAFYDWQHDRKLFPKEYWSYFERNEKARDKYIVGIVSKQEMETGHKPVLCDPYYNRDTFNPFGYFKPYEEKIRIYNETGKMYY